MSCDPTICEEIAPADSLKPDSGYELINKAQQERHKRRDAFLAVRPPQLQLDPELLPFVANRYINDPPRLHYGFLCSRDHLDDIVARYHITIGDGQPVETDHEREVYTSDAVSEYLQKKISGDLRIGVPFSARQDVYVIALDDTRRLRCARSKTWAKKAQPIFKKVRRELRLEPSARPMWYWSCSRDETYVCVLPKYNPPQFDDCL